VNVRLFGVVFIGIFCVWTLFDIQFAASYRNCSPAPGYGCPGAPIEATVASVLIPGIILLVLFIAILLRNREGSSSLNKDTK